MKDDDPEKRIRELERGLADVSHTPQSTPPYTSDTTYTSRAPYTSGAPYAGGFPYGFGVPRRRRRAPYTWLILVVAGVFLPTIISLVALFVRTTTHSSTPRFNFPHIPTSSAGPTAVPPGGQLRVGSDSSIRTIACNDGKLTLYGTNTVYSVTGHCSSLAVGGGKNNVTVDSADTLESTGDNNNVSVHQCNNGKLTLSANGMLFAVRGHCASLTISSYDNHVDMDSVDAINVSGYNNVVSYHTGTPKIADSGYSNAIQQG